MLLKDKVIIISGVGRGMGCKLAKVAASEGAKVVLAARTSAFLDEVAGEIRAAGGTCLAVPTDIAQSAQCEALVQKALAQFGRIDGLVNSAYTPATFTTFEEASIEDWQANMNVTCFGALRMVKAVLPCMKQQGGGAIVNVSALSAAQPSPGQADYSTSKAALEGATRQLAREFGPYQIRVNSTRMGWLWGTPVQGFLQSQADAHGLPLADLVAPIAARMALGVIPPDEECAKTALMLVSDYTRMVTGTVLDVNGGEYFSV